MICLRSETSFIIQVYVYVLIGVLVQQSYMVTQKRFFTGSKETFENALKEVQNKRKFSKANHSYHNYQVLIMVHSY